MEYSANKRRFCTIVMPGVTGFSRPMGHDGQATLRALTAYVALIPRGAEIP